VKATPKLEELLSTREAAAILSLAEVTLKLWRRRGVGPRFVRYNSTGPKGRIFYLRPDLEAFIAAHAVQPRRKAARRR
jgi:Helix-turn-helix domain